MREPHRIFDDLQQRILALRRVPAGTVEVRMITMTQQALSRFRGEFVAFESYDGKDMLEHREPPMSLSGSPCFMGVDIVVDEGLCNGGYDYEISIGVRIPR